VRRLVALAFVLLTVVLAISEAAEPTLEVGIEPERFGVEDAARLVVRITSPPSDVGEPQLGSLVNVRIVAGPSRGSEFSFVNGVSSSAISFSYVIRAEGEGPASIGPIAVTVGDGTLTAAPLTFDVAPGSLAPARRSRRVSPFPNDLFSDLYGRRQPVQEAKVTLRHIVAPRSVVVGQPVTAIVVLDATAAVDDFGWLTAPSYPGWWTQRVDPPEQITPELVEVDGVRINRFTISRHALIPLRAGELAIPEVRARVGTRGRGFLDPAQLVERSTPELKLTVAERPPAPDGFDGAVGDLRYTALVDPAEIAFGESTVLVVKLAGTGNLPLVETPRTWPSCDACELYPPEESSRVTVDDSGIHGSREWRVTVVPRQWGRLELGPVQMAVFDAATGSYRSQAIGPLELVVEAPAATPTPVAAVAPTPATSPSPEESRAASAPSDAVRLPWPVLAAAALGLGILVGGVAVWWLGGARRRSAIPPRVAGQSPAERARELQVTLERWWMDVRAKGDRKGVGPEMEALRRELEAVRFAPGRADHSETIVDLEERLRALMRRG
jgi:hypothetical protein